MTSPRILIPPDPEGSRRPGVPACSLVLADGRTWGLARPEPRYRPATGQAGGIATTQEAEVAVRLGYPWPIEELVARLGVACRSERGPHGDRERFDALMALATALVRRAHDLTRAEATSLLDFDLDADPGGWARLVDAVLNTIPKPSRPPDPGGPDA